MIETTERALELPEALRRNLVPVSDWLSLTRRFTHRLDPRTLPRFVLSDNPRGGTQYRLWLVAWRVERDRDAMAELSVWTGGRSSGGLTVPSTNGEAAVFGSLVITLPKGARPHEGLVRVENTMPKYFRSGEARLFASEVGFNA